MTKTSRKSGGKGSSFLFLPCLHARGWHTAWRDPFWVPIMQAVISATQLPVTSTLWPIWHKPACGTGFLRAVIDACFFSTPQSSVASRQLWKQAWAWTWCWLGSGTLRGLASPLMFMSSFMVKRFLIGKILPSCSRCHHVTFQWLKREAK